MERDSIFSEGVMAKNQLVKNRYKLLRKIAEGGFSDVYESLDTLLDKVVAVKRIKPEASAIGDAFEVLENEARTTANLEHRNIGQVLDYCREAGKMYMIMSFIKGMDLHDLIRTAAAIKKPIPFDVGAHIIAEVCNALYFAHNATEQTENGFVPLHIVHLDISPANIMIASDGSVKVIDFGVAKVHSRQKEALKNEGLRGKVSYMSPEQISGQYLDHRSDIFSLGVVMYEVLTGEKPYAGRKITQLIEEVKAAKVTFDRLAGHPLPYELQAVILRAIQRNPQERYQTAKEMFVEIDHWLRQNRSTRMHEAMAKYVEEMKMFQKMTVSKERTAEDSRKTVFVHSNESKTPSAVTADDPEPEIEDDEKTLFVSAQNFSDASEKIKSKEPAPADESDGDEKTMFWSGEENQNEKDKAPELETEKTLFLDAQALEKASAKTETEPASPPSDDADDKTLFLQSDEAETEQATTQKGVEPQDANNRESSRSTAGLKTKYAELSKAVAGYAKRTRAACSSFVGNFKNQKLPRFFDQCRSIYSQYSRVILSAAAGLAVLLLLIVFWPSPKEQPLRYFAVEIQTDNPEAEKFVFASFGDRTTPLRADSLLAGSYIVEARLGSIVRSRPVKLDSASENTTHVFLAFNTTLSFDANVPEAAVEINDSLHHLTTPFDTTGVFQGEMRVRMFTEGFDTLSVIFTVGSLEGDDSSHVRQFSAPNGGYRIVGSFYKTLRLKTIPANASVFKIDEADTSTIDLAADGKNILLPAGEHQLLLRRDGFIDESINVKVAASRKKFIAKSITLAREIEVHAGRGARVIQVLGANEQAISRRVVALPSTFKLRARAHKLFIVRPGYIDSLITIKAEEFGVKNISLQRQPEGVAVKLVDHRTGKPVYAGRVGYFQGELSELGEREYKWMHVNSAGSYSFPLQEFEPGKNYVFRGESPEYGYGAKTLSVTLSDKPQQAVELRIIKFKK